LLQVSFGTIQNARTEYLSFDVVEMYYPYNAILGRGFLNKFEAIIHQAYLCVKIPAMQGVITIWGRQNDGRNLERGQTPRQRNVNALDEAVKSKEAEKQPKADKEKVKVQPDCDTKKVLLDVMSSRHHWVRSFARQRGNVNSISPKEQRCLRLVHQRSHECGSKLH
jgi:hypothetical protein